MDTTEAQKVLEADRRRREAEGQARINKICEELNIELLSVCGEKEKSVPVQRILTMKISIIVVAK